LIRPAEKALLFIVSDDDAGLPPVLPADWVYGE
jgi:hypothetical protein